MICVSRGSFAAVDGEIDWIFLSATITVTSDFGSAPVASISVTWVIASGPGACFFEQENGKNTHSSNSTHRSQPPDFSNCRLRTQPPVVMRFVMPKRFLKSTQTE